MTERQCPIKLVSLGSGDPELLTLKAIKALQVADGIFCPETRNGVSRSADILRQAGIAETVIHRFLLPMSKQRDKAESAYDNICKEILGLQGDGKNVCVVAEGDAGLYSSTHYVLERLQAMHIDVEQIAGIPAFIAAGAHRCMHIVQREERLTIIPGNASAEEIERLVANGGRVVVMKLSQCADEIHKLLRLHPEYAYDYFENLGTAAEICLDSATQIDEHCFPYFSMLMIGA